MKRFFLINSLCIISWGRIREGGIFCRYREDFGKFFCVGDLFWKLMKLEIGIWGEIVNYVISLNEDNLVMS